jgi:hypothetical protein
VEPLANLGCAAFAHLQHIGIRRLDQTRRRSHSATDKERIHLHPSADAPAGRSHIASDRLRGPSLYLPTGVRMKSRTSLRSPRVQWTRL